MKGNEKGSGVSDVESSGRVADEERSDINEIEAFHQSVIPFVPVHRGEARADDTIDRCAIERCMKGKERGDRVVEEGSHGGNEIEALHQPIMPFAPVHRSDARADGVGVRAAVDVEEEERQRSHGGRR
ncbi:hypothetical protein Syun_021198 [Stephania yunnanensis]|uniref:Uncharacterized protein n=1 Tax=Stephania yunnanensis TaxID=152371 RepID=A0AAP0NS34_9MAGN